MKDNDKIVKEKTSSDRDRKPTNYLKSPEEKMNKEKRKTFL
jgi:hypothetical protein